MALRKTRPATPAAIPSVPATPARSEVKGSGTAPKPIVRTFTHSDIAKRAYEIYAGRGYAAGNPDEDWREAERQLRAGL
jgi:hypothetical protein